MAAVAEFMVPVVPSVTPEWEMKNRQFMCGAPEDAVATNNLGVFYSPSQPVLDGISLVIRRGEATALVGLTGSGKTTLLDTLAGLRHPQRGYLHLSAKTGYLTQEPCLLFGTTLANLCYPPRRIDREPRPKEAWVIREAAIQSAADQGATIDMFAAIARGCSDLVLDLLRNVGKGGAALSGGQRQLVAAGRLAWQPKDVWLLDEPTGAMDADAEQRLLDWILGQKKDRILLMTTHKLSLAARFDRILVLHRGKIVQDGTHDELVKEDGLYQRLWRLQEVT